ncbi:MAG: Dbl homology domain-containing protein [Benjaminiella poitrasii]|nr:MAG: Dbl homology domain-containing protein [Benjaminiella poitrasii]
MDTTSLYRHKNNNINPRNTTTNSLHALRAKFQMDHEDKNSNDFFLKKRSSSLASHHQQQSYKRHYHIVGKNDLPAIYAKHPTDSNKTIVPTLPDSYPSSEKIQQDPLLPDLRRPKSAMVMPTRNTENNKKRSCVIQEMISTERRYQADMELVKEIYYDQAWLRDPPLFSKLEMKQIFVNLPDIVAFEKKFMSLLLDQSLSRAFSLMASILIGSMEQIYGEYCKRHEDAICKIQELNTTRPTVQDCKEKIQGRTMSWDLPSLLIKPVQRILKYPLLLKEIVALSSEKDPDYQQLVKIFNEIQQVADHINEIKRRKDLVEQIIKDHKRILDKNVNSNSKKNTSHSSHSLCRRQGFNKRISRRVHRHKKDFSTTTHDTFFDDLYRQFISRQTVARQFERDVQAWAITTCEHAHALSRLINSLDTILYNNNRTLPLPHTDPKRASFKTLVCHFEFYSMESKLQRLVYGPIASYLKLFKNPLQVIQKRNRKFIDYDRMMMSKNKNSQRYTMDHPLQLSAEAYLSLNAHLLDELPVFLDLTANYFAIIVDDFRRIQTSYWQHCQQLWKKTLFAVTNKTMTTTQFSWKSIENDYFVALQEQLQPRLNQIISTNTTYKSLPDNKYDYSQLHNSNKSSSLSKPKIPSPPSRPTTTVVVQSNNTMKDTSLLFNDEEFDLMDLLLLPSFGSDFIVG